MSFLQKAEALVKELITTDKYYNIEFDSAKTIKGLTKIPLISKYTFTSEPSYMLIQEAQKQGYVKVKEQGTVPELEVLNQSQYPILIPCGSMFVSQKYGQQDRAAITDIMIDAGSKKDIPVVCIEEHRWSPRSDAEVRRIFGDRNLVGDSDFSAHYLVTPRVSRSLHSSTTKCLVSSIGEPRSYGLRNRPRSYRADQQRVWKDVDEEIHQADAKTPTKSLTEVHLKKEKEAKVDFEIYDKEIGNIFLGMGRVLAMELYHSPKTWQAIAEQTIKRYKMDVDKEVEPKQEIVNSFLKDLRECKPLAVESVGLGYDVRLTDGNVDGACLVVQKTPIHFTAIPSKGGETKTQARERISISELTRYSLRRGRRG